MEHKMPLSTFKPYYQVENRMHSQVNQLHECTNAWIREYQCLSPTIQQKTQIANYGILTAQILPDSPYEILLPITRWMLWAFIYDDYYGPLPKDELAVICGKAIRILQGAQATSEDNTLFQQLSIIRDELKAITTKEWMHRFISDHRYYFEGLIMDSYSYKQNIKYPSSTQYLAIRDRLIGGFMVCDLLELAAGILPEEIFLHPFIQRIRLLSTRLMIWDNDIFSYKKELAENEAMNFVLILASEKALTIEGALHEVFSIREADYLELTNFNIPEFGIYNGLVNNYYKNILVLLQGQLEWYKKKSQRYH